MPGVPPDALDQLKRGFKGLFGRKKKAEGHGQTEASASQQKPSTTSSETQAPTITTTAPSPSPGPGAEQKTRIDDGFPPPPPGPPPHSGNEGSATTQNQSQPQQISEPAAVGEAKNIDLDPSSTTTAPTATSAAPADTPATTTTAPSNNTAGTPAPAALAAPTQAVDQNGMSATSGPLDDTMGLGEYEPGKGSVDDPDGGKFLQKERDLENDMPAEEGTGGGPAAAKEEKAQVTQTATAKA